MIAQFAVHFYLYGTLLTPPMVAIVMAPCSKQGELFIGMGVQIPTISIVLFELYLHWDAFEVSLAA